MGRKKRKPEDEGGPDLLQMMTVSLFIILLAFFIMLNAIAVVDENRQRVALGSLMENFGILSGGFSVDKGKDEPITTTPITKVTSLIDFNDMLKNEDEMAQDLVVTAEKNRSVLSIPCSRLFEPDGVTLIPRSHTMLQKLSRIINKNKYPVDIIGHVPRDDIDKGGLIPPRELSALRAQAVQVFFIEKGNVSPKLLTAYGWGEFRPAVTNRTRETRSLNRRVDVVFVHKGRQQKPEGFFTFKDFFFDVFDKKKE